MNELALYRTLSSSSRVQILRLLYRKPLSVEEIAKEMNLQAITVRHHLQSLMEAGIVEYHEEHSGTVGRPRAYYKLAKTLPVMSFPRRQYQVLSEFLINAMVGVFGKDKAIAFLKKVGAKMGEDTVRKLESEYDIKSWSTKEYEEYFVKGYLKKEGAEPEVIEVSDNKIVYRLHNCLFLELAIKTPDIMCDVLHENFHEGVSKAIGKKIKISRSTCAGHGDPFCEHVCVWMPENKIAS